MANFKWVSTSGNPCPSCYALNGQVHSEEVWEEFGVAPRDELLYCKEACSCQMEETDEEETGELKDVPLRHEEASAQSAGSSPPLLQAPSARTQEKNMTKKIMPILRSMPITDKLDLPKRAEIMPQIESGELDHIDFTARTFRAGKNKNYYVFQDKDLESFAHSFEGQPFLRNHDTYDIGARDGTITDSTLEGNEFKQTIRLTTRRGMLDFVEGRIDRFSIGWYYDDVLCSICNQTWFSSACYHWPGKTYEVGESKTKKQCELIFVNPKGKETSAVNTPAVDGTGIESLQEYKLSLQQPQEANRELIGVNAVSHVRSTSDTPGQAPAAQLLKGVKTMLVKVRRNGAVLMVEESEVLSTDERIAEDPTLTQIEVNRQAAAQLLGETDRMNQMQAQLDESNKVLVAQCEFLLNAGLAASRLPEVVQKRIRKTFASRAFQASELTAAITEAREELAALTQGANVQGPGRTHYEFGLSNKDQFRIALEDLFGLERAPEEAKIKVHKLAGINEAYRLATGDEQFIGGYFPEFALVTANFPGIVANVQNKMLIDAWKDFENSYGWWTKIVTIEHFTNLKTATWVRTGTIASLPIVAERGEYPELAIGDIKETSEWGKYGGYVPLTIEAVINDDLRAFVRMPRECALAGMRNISEQVAAIFTTNSAAGPVMTDTGALFNATAQTTKGGHINLLTTALGTDYTAWNAVATAMYKKKLMVKNDTGYYGTGKPQGLKPSICLVPADLITPAEALFVPRWDAQAQNVPATASVRWGGRVDPVAVPEWTDATDWAAVIDPKLRPGIMLGEIFGVKPQIFSASSEVDPAMFANDESRIKVRQFVTVGVADDLPLHKNNVA